MPIVKFTTALKRFHPSLEPLQVDGSTVKSIIDALNNSHPGLKDYLLDEKNRLRQHVNIFVGNKMVEDRKGLSDPVKEADEIYIMQALSGGLL